jgi:hypothetical protein
MIDLLLLFGQIGLANDTLEFTNIFNDFQEISADTVFKLKTTKDTKDVKDIIGVQNIINLLFSRIQRKEYLQLQEGNFKKIKKIDKKNITAKIILACAILQFLSF